MCDCKPKTVYPVLGSAGVEPGPLCMQASTLATDLHIPHPAQEDCFCYVMKSVLKFEAQYILSHIKELFYT